MSLETGDWIKDLVQSNPPGSDPKSRGDDHLRLIKHVLQTQFSGLTLGKPITLNEDQINAAMQPGQYGVGGVGPLVNESDIQNNALAMKTGTYTVQNQALGFLPTSTGFYFLKHTLGHGAGQCEQVCARVDGPNREFHRQYAAGTGWSTWAKMLNNVDTPEPTSTLPPGNTLMMSNTYGQGRALDGAAQSLNVLAGAYNGRWQGSAMNDLPPGVVLGASWCAVEWLQGSTDGLFGQQRFMETNTDRQWVRNRVNNSWHAWAELLTTFGWSPATQPGYLRLGPIQLHWGFAGPIADDADLRVNFGKANVTTLGVFLQNATAGLTGTTFQELDLGAWDATGFNARLRTNGASTVNFFWFAIGIL